MALSQIQCLDDNHINARTNESKPDFLYSEDQRLALETLLGDGREAFVKYLEARGLRGFLSDLEQETLAGAVEPYDPGSEVFPEGADENEPPLSLHYWPELSDTSVPLMDLGWPDSEAYRGVTRTTVYTQPPLEGQTHVKEIVRKMIAQAQKVIAVVMDAFTDVDIFRDLLDASFKRRVSVYILLEHRMLPHFLSMCRRANMHAGHLKHLRVRFSEGTEFYTRSCTKVRGQMGHRFMFIDGDKAVSGSYSFTWMSSRLDRNLITVVTGQAVDVFDRLFRCLYMNSRFVDLREVAVAPEPEPEPIPQPVSVPLPSAALARKLYNPKYALVTVGNHSPASTPSPGNNSPKDSQAPDEIEKKKRRRRRSLEAQEAPPLHPGLVNLEKAALIAYLPTWPEPDPPSDVIGFINIRDSNKPSPVHLQRSEMFGTSQAIRFSSPISAPKETLPEVAKPRQVATETKVRSEHQQTQDKSKAEEPTKLHNGPVDVATKNKEPEQKPAASALKSAPVKNNTEALSTQHNLNSNTPDTRPPLLSSSKPPTPNTESPSDATQTVSTNKLVSLPAANAVKETQTKPSLNTKQSVMTENMNHTQEVKNTHLHTDSNPVAEKTGAHTLTDTQSQFAPEIQVSASSAAITHPLPVSSTCDTTHVPIAAAQPSAAPRPSPSPPPKQLATSPCMSLMSTPPVPKPRTIHLISRDASSKQDPLKFKQPDNPAPQPSVDNSPQTLPDAEDSTTITQVDSGNVGETQQKKTPAEMEVEEDVGSRSGTQTGPAAALQTQSDALIASRPNAESMHIQEAVSKEAEREALMSGDGDVTPKPQSEPVHTEKTETRADREIAEEVPNLIRENVTQSESHLERPDETLSASSCEANSGTTKTFDSLKAETQDGTDVEESCAPSPAENNTQGTSKGEEACTQTPSKPVGLSLCNSRAPELRSPTPEKESLLLDALMRSPTPDVLLQRTPTPDFHTPTPDFRSATPDFRTPTPVSDGYTSTKEDSTTSDEYYECSDSPVPEPDRGGATEGRATSTTASPTHVVEDSAAKTADKQKEAQTPRRKKAPSKPAAETQADGGATPVQSTAKQTEPKRSSTCDLKAEETGVSKGAPAPAVEKKSDKLPASRDTGGHTQQGVVAFQSSQQPQQSRPQRSFSSTQLAGSQSWGSGLLNQVDPKAHHSSTQVLDYTSSSRKALHRPAPPHAAAHKHAAPHGQQAALSRQTRARGGPSQDQSSYPKPPTSFLQQRNPPSQNRAASAQESHRQEEGRVPFSFSFSRLYTLKGLREKIGKIPAQSKRSSTPAQNHHHSSS